MPGFTDQVNYLYAAHGTRCLLPFIGEGYEAPRAEQFRIAVVGFNSYISPEDWPRHDVRWFRGWWQQAGHGSDTYRFYNAAFAEVARLASALGSGDRWSSLACDLSPPTKRSLYATNAIKVYTGEEYKKSAAIPEPYIRSFEGTWRSELDVMACRGCLPHLIVVLGARIWETHWKSLHPATARADYFNVRSYLPAGCDGQPVRTHAAFVTLESGRGLHSLLLVRLHHPSARAPRRDANWLLGCPEFHSLAGLPSSVAG